MALCRCKEFHSNPKGRGNNVYVNFAYPIGYPETSSICGISSCSRPGLIWLTEDENNQYNAGTRIFSYSTSVTKVKVL